VVAVTKGFRGFREVNMVWFNPELVGRDQMIQALKRAGTYRGLAE